MTFSREMVCDTERFTDLSSLIRWSLVIYGKTHYNGDSVDGKWIAIDWRWDGTVKDFSEDDSWEFQIPPPNTVGMKNWNALDGEGGKKTEVSVYIGEIKRMN